VHGVCAEEQRLVLGMQWVHWTHTRVSLV
jgi:hypothetical protein